MQSTRKTRPISLRLAAGEPGQRSAHTAPTATPMLSAGFAQRIRELKELDRSLRLERARFYTQRALKHGLD